jgi:hypothetical protein
MARVRVPLLLSLLSCWVGVAAADDKLDLQQFHPPATYSPYLGIDAPSVLLHLRGAAGLFFSYGRDALLLRGPTGALIPAGELVAHQLWLEAVGSVGLFDRFEVGLAVPIALYQGGDDAPPGNDAAGALRGARGAALGDLRVDGKVLLVDHVFGRRPGALDSVLSPSRLQLALVVGLTMPTSTTELAGEGNVTGRPRLALEYAWRRLRIGLNLGAIFRARSHVLDLDVTHQLTWGAALRILLGRGVELTAEGRGAVGVAPPRGGHVGAPDAPTEIDAGLSYGGSWGWGLRGFLAGGVGLGEGYGTPSGRLLAGLRFIAPAHQRELTWAERDDDHDGILNIDDRCPREAGLPNNGGCPDVDSDGDGVVDRLDHCPTRAGVAANDGCPDYDGDGDGVVDRLDRCPRDFGPRENGGCPLADRDRDGVPDSVDRCPDSPGVAANDGCPDVDSDGDGLVDRLDKCPFDAEVYNGIEDEDGCPDVGVALAAVEPGGIKVFEPIAFEKVGAGERLTARSQQIVAAVAGLLKAHVEIKRLRIDGHTDKSGRAIDNLDLSLSRAQKVRHELVERWKIDPKRLSAQGFGSDRPLVESDTPLARARNRRIEFTTLETAR